uniref:Serine/threonine-protein phosphatase 4 regulatory subunit 2-A n=1 Tax=Aceria tosichella TaxID=561515 RepID=A0A6G1SIR3_9ACAR
MTDTGNEQSPNTTETDPLLASLRDIATSGIVEIQWADLQASLKARLEQVIEMYQKQKDCKETQLDEPNVEKFNLDNSRDEILELIESFTEPPFTIQRICELLSWPLKYYDRVSTFLRGLEKNLRVISANDWPKSQSPPNSLKEGEAIT